MNTKIAYLDFETDGLPVIQHDYIYHPDNWPNAVTVAVILKDYETGNTERYSAIIKPVGFTIPDEMVKFHGISQEKAMAEGQDPKKVFAKVAEYINKADYVAGHNIEAFDLPILKKELHKLKMHYPEKPAVDTKLYTSDLLQIPKKSQIDIHNPTYKHPKLNELAEFLKTQERQGEDKSINHSAAEDLEINMQCLEKLIEMEWFTITKTRFDHKNEKSTPTHPLVKAYNHEAAFGSIFERVQKREQIDANALTFREKNSSSALETLWKNTTRPQDVLTFIIAANFTNYQTDFSKSQKIKVQMLKFIKPFKPIAYPKAKHADLIKEIENTIQRVKNFKPKAQPDRQQAFGFPKRGYA